MRSTNRYLRTACLLLMFCFTSLGAFAQGSVSGTVRDAAGEPMVGAVVSVENSTAAAITDVNGRFSIQAAPQGVIIVSSFGYVTRNVAVEGRSQIDIVMDVDSQVLEDVVVIGYGTQRREAVTGSVASVRGDVMREVPAGNITQALAGRIAGVQMTQSSSRPGEQMQVRIRGVRSLQADNDPLVVLDGIPFAGKLADIDPNSIKGIDILKDASATAIYGSRGANGVIMVTTKTGTRNAGTTATVSYSGYYGIKNAIRVDMMDGPQTAALKKYVGENGLPAYSILGADEGWDVNTDWQDMLLRKGFVNSHDVSVSGGTNSSTYSLGAGYYKDQSVIPTANFQRFSLRANIDMEVGKYFRFGLMSNSNYNYTQGGQLGLDSALSRSALADPYNEDGSLKRVVVMANSNDNGWVYSRETIEANKEIWRNDTKTLGTFNTIFAEIKAPWVEGLKYRVNLGLNYTQTHNGVITGADINTSTTGNPATASVDNRNTVNWAVENLLTFDRTFNDKHNLNIVALYSAEQTTYNRSNIRGRDIPDDSFQYWNIGRAEGDKTVDPNNQAYWQRGLLSYMGRVMYSYDNRYMISAAIRSDASSVLAPGHQWHTYPAVSVGWNIANEKFMENASWIDQLKLRVGYGQTSNQAIDPYKTMGLLGTRPYNFGVGNHYTGYVVSELANKNLGWEFSTTWNFGVDFGLFNNRLTGTIEYYRQNTNDVLLPVRLPDTAGVTEFMANIGKTQNRGVEITLNGVIIDNQNGWSWEAGVNFYANRNKLTQLSSGVSRNEGNAWFVGHPINVIYDYEAIGLWQEGDKYMSELQPNAGLGSIKVKYTGGYNEDGTPVRSVDGTDRQIIHLDPKFQGGFNTRVTWKNLDLNIVGSFQRGGTLVSTLYQAYGYLNMLSGRRGQVDVDYWTPTNTDAKWPNPVTGRGSDNHEYLNSMGYFDASYLKINTISLGYNLPKKWLDKAGISNIRVYATAQNPFVLFSPYHKESGLDPEPNAGSRDGYIAASSDQIPQRTLVVGTNIPNTRNFLFGVNLTF